MAQRRQPPKKGAVVTFKFQELSNGGIPRFPVFLRIRSDLTWKDVLEAAKTKQPISTKAKIVPTTKLSKQHSILFSSIPSRDSKTGKKVVADEETDAALSSSSSAAKPKKAITRKTSAAASKAKRAVAPITTDRLLIKDKNAGLEFDEEDDQEEEPPKKTTASKRKRTVEEEKPASTPKKRQKRNVT